MSPVRLNTVNRNRQIVSRLTLEPFVLHVDLYITSLVWHRFVPPREVAIPGAIDILDRDGVIRIRRETSGVPGD